MSHNRVPRSPSPGGGAFPRVDRRTVLKGFAGAAGVAAVPGLAACGGDDDSGGEGGSGNGGGTVTFGSNYSDAKPKQAMEKVLAAAKTSAGVDVKVNTVDHNTFQEQINSYLGGTPDDVFAWFAGYRMQFFAKRGLASPIDDVWEKIGGNFPESLKAASKGEDGKMYFVPLYMYPWAVFYRKSVFAERGYQVPKTLDEFKALATQMQRDKLVPIGFADKDGWPAMGTFDILNMRINGYQYHIDLMAGKEGWDTDKTKQVFRTWAELMPYHAPGALGRTWQEAGQLLHQKKTGMYLLGMFVGQQFPAKDVEDLDYFPFPEINPEHGTDSIDAPIDGHMLSKKPKNEDGAKKLLEFLGSPEAQNLYNTVDPSYVATSPKADTSSYSTLQKKAVELIGSAKHIAQFLDRDTRPDFASTVIIPSFQQFIRTPNDIDGLTKKIEQQKKTIFVD
jgi:multiple sugar transport system substrate-binding protein